MSDDKPELNRTEMRQGNSRRMNLRVLMIAIVVVAIGFALALWWNTGTSPETETTMPAGEGVEDAAPAGQDEELDDVPLPAPDEPDELTEPAPGAEADPVEVQPDPEGTAEDADTQ